MPSSSLFDSAEFNARLFFPRDDVTQAPEGALDIDVDVTDARLHLRIHRALPIERATVLLFHGNGEVVCDYDGIAARFASIGARLAIADFRGYGRSTGAPTLPRVVEDSKAVVDALVASAT